jgi:hypothetical protein
MAARTAIVAGFNFFLNVRSRFHYGVEGGGGKSFNVPFRFHSWLVLGEGGGADGPGLERRRLGGRVAVGFGWWALGRLQNMSLFFKLFMRFFHLIIVATG